MMDPQTALYDALVTITRIPDADHQTERDHVAERLRAVAHWIQSGGFVPQIHRDHHTVIVPQYATKQDTPTEQDTP